MADRSEMTKSPAMKSAARRRQLIDATIAAIGRRGYASTTLTHVAGEAGLSPGIVNFYFKTKEQLLLATLEQITDEYAAFLREQLEKAGPSPAAQLEAMIDADFDPKVFTLEKVAVWYAFWAEAHTQPSYRALVSRMEGQYYNDTAEPCRRIIEAGGYADIDPDAVASGLNAMIDGFWFDFLIDPKEFDREAAKRTCRLFLAGLFPREFQSRIEPASRKRTARSPEPPTENLAADAYIDPAFLAREAAQLFPRSWQLVCHESELPGAGDFATFDLLRDGAFVVRGDDGQLRAFLNVCRHRAARLVDGAPASRTGSCGHAVTCPYHGWSYDFAGRLKAVPAERSFAQIDWASHGLLPIELALFHGLVFVRFGAKGGPSVEALMAPYGEEIAAYRLADMRRLGAVEARRVAVNWKTVVDDFRQGYEVSLAHPGLSRLFGGAYETEVADHGIARSIGILRDKPAEGWSERHYQTLLPEIAHLPPELQRCWQFFSLFPNTTLTLQPDQVVATQVLPVTPEESLIRTRRYALPQADRALAAARYLGQRINRQVARDNDQMLLGVQRGLASGHAPAGPIADSEIAVRQFHALLRRLLAVQERPAARG
jgi:phenylpropionate dioxygenase-like ring-hydroxylating dioxygenase large terminal subunit/DNA-binding transcriptional regulator YbjK